MRASSATATMVLLALCAGCDGRSATEVREVPAGWQAISPLAGGGDWPSVGAALPPGLEVTGETGIDTPVVSYRGADIEVRFALGAEGAPAALRAGRDADFAT